MPENATIDDIRSLLSKPERAKMLGFCLRLLLEGYSLYKIDESKQFYVFAKEKPKHGKEA